MPKEFTLQDYKQELTSTINRTAKEGWEYLVRHGVSESEVCEAAQLAVSNDMELLREAWLRTRVAPRQVRALGGQLRKQAEALEKVIVQFPDLLPPFLASHLRTIETRDIPAFLKTIADKLTTCRPKASAVGDATVRKGRIASTPNVAAGLFMLHLFSRAAADFYAQETCVRFNSPTVELPPSPVAKNRYAQSAALLNLACRLAHCPEIFSSDYLQKMEEVRSIETSLSGS